MNIQDILKEENAHIIDVREPYEFKMDHIPNAVNMPLSRFETHLEEIKKLNGSKVFYCRSGNRSGQVVNFLKANGMDEVYNGGGLGLIQSYLIGR